MPPLDYETIMDYQFPDLDETYTKKDAMLYALGVGCGSDPLDPDHLQFTFEKDLKCVPTMPVVLGRGPQALHEIPELSSIDFTMLVHGEQKLVIHKPLSAEGRVETSTRVIQILDKGADKGAIMYRERKMTCGITGDALATLGESFFLRGSGGFGGQPGPTPPAHTLPEREPEESLDIATLPQAALIYRLSGDYNPLHAEPAFAARAGFDKPILHGLCSFGVTCRAVLKTYCGGVPERLKSIQVRFSAPVFPGETIRTEMWRDGSEVSFRARVVGRGVLVINNGKAEIAD